MFALCYLCVFVFVVCLLCLCFVVLCVCVWCLLCVCVCVGVRLFARVCVFSFLCVLMTAAWSVSVACLCALGVVLYLLFCLVVCLILCSEVPRVCQVGFRGSPSTCRVRFVGKSDLRVECGTMCRIGIDLRLSNLGSYNVELMVSAYRECVCGWPYTGV